MSPDEAALLAAVAASPADDAPRLIYADWLDEHGRPERAEFIRLQIALTNPVVAANWRGELRQVEKAIRRVQCLKASRWQCETPDVAGARWGEYARGFVEEVTVDPDADFAARDDAGRLLPLRVVCFDGLPDAELSDVFARPFSAAPRVEVRFRGYRRERVDAALAVFAAHPWPARTAELELLGLTVDDTRAALLASAPAGRYFPLLRLWGHKTRRSAYRVLTGRFGKRVELL